MIERSLGTPGFLTSNLHKNPQAPALEHFTPVTKKDGVRRDRFGNRIFPSPSFSYFDREGRETKATLLVSPLGERFIKENRGVLNDIDRGLRQLRKQDNPQKEIDLGNNRWIRKYLSNVGSQSEIYILSVGFEQFVLKIKRAPSRLSNNVSQPYVNEMFQCQELATDLKKQLDKLGVEMSQFLFSSSEIACRKFEEGIESWERVSEGDRIGRLGEIIDSYIKGKQRRGIVLWNKKGKLWRNMARDVGYNIPRNVIKRSDGKLVCIDPITYWK